VFFGVNPSQEHPDCDVEQ